MRQEKKGTKLYERALKKRRTWSASERGAVTKQECWNGYKNTETPFVLLMQCYVFKLADNHKKKRREKKEQREKKEDHIMVIMVNAQGQSSKERRR